MYIGVIVFDIRNYYFAQMVNSIESEAHKMGYFVNITLHEKDKEKEVSLVNSLVDRRVDGIIICPVNKGEEFEKFLKALPIPVVIIGNRVSDRIPYVGIDEKKATRDAIELILSKGYRRIIFVCPPLVDRELENIYAHEQRTESFIECTGGEAGLESMIISGYDYLEQLESILPASQKRTAVFCSGDIYALNVMMKLKKSGIHVPEDLGLMGFDNIDTLEYISPSVATISNSVNQVACVAVDSLVKLMNGKSIEQHILVNHTLIDGESI